MSKFVGGLLVGILAAAVIVVLVFFEMSMRPVAVPESPAMDLSGYDLRLSAQEAFIGNLIQQSFLEGSDDLEKVVVDIQPAGRMEIGIQVDGNAFGLPFYPNFTLAAALTIQNQQLFFVVTEVGVGSVQVPPDGLPDAVSREIASLENKINSVLGNVITQNGFRPTNLTSDEDALHISLRALW